jgi:hypothetical protein
VQFEFGFLLGPPDSRYLVDRDRRLVVALKTLGAPERRRLGGKRPRKAQDAEPEPVPTSRATVISGEPFADGAAAAAWLGEQNRDALAGLAGRAAEDLNMLIRAHRAAALDPYGRDVTVAQALVTRVGYGMGDQVAEGRFQDALVLPAPEPGRAAHDPSERLAALLSGRDSQMACEELVLRARADIAAGRPREAALQARVALEAFLFEMRDAVHHADRGDLEAARSDIGKAANAALHGNPPSTLQAAVDQAVRLMERELRRRPVPPPAA